MLRPEDIELIHREIDGENTPESSAAFRSLVDRDSEARALAADLREIAALFGKVEERPSPPHLRHAIVAALQQPVRASPESPSMWMSVQAFVRRTRFQLRSATIRVEEAMNVKKSLILGSAAVAAVAIIGLAVLGYPPTGRESGTI